MKNYNLEANEGVHIIKITIQDGEYKGNIFTEMGGNCKGVSIIESVMDYFQTTCEGEIGENDCGLKYSDEDEYWDVILRNDEGGFLHLDYMDSEDMANMIVAIEIVAFYEE